MFKKLLLLSFIATAIPIYSRPIIDEKLGKRIEAALDKADALAEWWNNSTEQIEENMDRLEFIMDTAIALDNVVSKIDNLSEQKEAADLIRDKIKSRKIRSVDEEQIKRLVAELTPKTKKVADFLRRMAKIEKMAEIEKMKTN